jgi:hypothetical protein
MFRIDNSTVIPSLPIASAPVTPGYFSDGNPASGLPATVVDAWWCNMLQEEILTVISSAGITPDKTSHRQLFDALNALYTPAGQAALFCRSWAVRSHSSGSMSAILFNEMA